MASITFSSVAKTYKDGTQAVRDLTLCVNDGELMILVGPSGCGKTTALRMVAGLEEISAGEVRIGDRIVNGIDPASRDIAMVFQNYALYPHLTVFENMAFPLRARKVSKADMRSRVQGAAALLGLTQELPRRPKNLSGGQRQRVAMGRAIVREPQAFLMDEPLSNLDAKLRVQTRAEIASLQRRLGVTTIYVTHDQVEAMTMGSRLAVMRKGVLQQEGEPQRVYDNPANLFVASFIGSPGMNLVQARLDRDGDGLACCLVDQAIPLPRAVVAEHRELARYVGKNIAIGIRPEHLAPANGGPSLRFDLALSETLGAERLLHVALAAQPVRTEEVLEAAKDADGAPLSLDLEADERHITLVARVDADYAPAVGTEIALGVVVKKLHFFDIDTGAAIR
jgi:multiple sugar transport system ATP-binding protein